MCVDVEVREIREVLTKKMVRISKAYSPIFNKKRCEAHLGSHLSKVYELSASFHLVSYVLYFMLSLSTLLELMNRLVVLFK